jgi:NAD(P)-dependent dehydrogenase (short-subunit alcohol dehydrogenase family)
MTSALTIPSRPVAVVTGASAGVGRATAVELARRGHDVALLARGAAGLEAAAAEVRSEGGRALPIPTDVSDFDQVDRAAARVEAELGPIAVWVNDAMTTVFQRVVDTEPDDFARAVDVTFLGQVWGTMAALARMRPRDAGVIVNVGSALAFLGIPLQAPYCASKFACRGFFESVRAELLEEGSSIRIGMVHLPAVNTPQFDWCQTNLDRHPQPVPPIYQPEVAARAIADCAADGRRDRVLGTWNRLIVAAASAFPGFANRFAAISGAKSQLTDQPVRADRPSNLRHPADDESDHGAHGGFDDRAAGVLDPSFLRSIPHTAAQFLAALRDTVLDRFVRPRWPDPRPASDTDDRRITSGAAVGD